jgi:hypothetical protein
VRRLEVALGAGDEAEKVGSEEVAHRAFGAHDLRLAAEAAQGTEHRYLGLSVVVAEEERETALSHPYPQQHRFFARVKSVTTQLNFFRSFVKMLLSLFCRMNSIHHLRMKY